MRSHDDRATYRCPSGEKTVIALSYRELILGDLRYSEGSFISRTALLVLLAPSTTKPPVLRFSMRFGSSMPDAVRRLVMQDTTPKMSTLV